MKHLKNYGTSKIEELSEYLQEFFDKFHIIYKEYNDDLIFNHHNYRNPDGSLQMYHTVQHNTILIQNISSKIYLDVMDELSRIKSNIELRLGLRMKASQFDEHDDDGKANKKYYAIEIEILVIR